MVLPVCLHEAGMAEMLERGKISSEVRGHFLAFRCIYLSKGAVYKHFWLEVRILIVLQATLKFERK